MAQGVHLGRLSGGGASKWEVDSSGARVYRVGLRRYRGLRGGLIRNLSGGMSSLEVLVTLRGVECGCLELFLVVKYEVLLGMKSIAKTDYGAFGRAWNTFPPIDRRLCLLGLYKHIAVSRIIAD